MAASDLISSLIQGGVLGLGALLGNHTNAASTAQTYLMIIEAAADNPPTVVDNADLLAATLATTDPLSAALAKQIKKNANNPAMVLQLANQIAQSIVAHNAGIMSNLSAIVTGANAMGNTTLSSLASNALLNKAISG